MKSLLMLACLACLTLGAAPDDPAAYHEFGVFGKHKIYLTHYPMFHAIHAYQAIIEVSLAKDGRDISAQFFQDRDQHPDRSYTLSPSKPGSPVTRRRDDWRLPDHIRAGVDFNGDLHWGDKTNQFLVRDVTVTVKQVIHFRQFQENDQPDRDLSYLLFGDADDLYLAHRIAAYPDFDQIVSVATTAGAMPTAGFTMLQVHLPDRPTNRLRAANRTVDAQVTELLGPGPDSARQYPSLESGHPQSGSTATPLTIRILKEVSYSELDEQS